jgi:hypothetical protein
MNTNVDITTKKQGGITGKGFVKGKSGNPNGRPVGSVSIVEGIKKKLQEIEPGNKKTYLELFLSKLFLKAINEGNEQLMRDMINRVDGMPKQSVEVGSKSFKVDFINADTIED